MGSSKPAITVIGSLNVDLVIYTPRLPAAGETLTASSFHIGLGGKGANQAVACAKLSRRKADVQSSSSEAAVTVRMVGAVGDDAYGRMLTRGLEEVGLDISGIAAGAGTKTGVAMIIVETATSENRIMLSPEANTLVRPEQFLDRIPAPKPDLLILQLEIPAETVMQILITAQRENIAVLLNPAPAIPIEERYYRAVSHLVMNETEASILSGRPESDLETPEGRGRLAQGFHNLGVRNVLITLGSRGVCYSTSEGRRGHVAAEKVTALDTTAAGDTFIGAYALEVIKAGFDIEDAVRKANKAASVTVGRRGAQESIPWKDEL